ncbi:DUF4913 domain-containing protein [Lysinibacter sp. HNR]|uniref:DUF4913 domain-containing protein n=1 Tax=Lysinibacter sp. HNR TaxID=3031408 RepID=UPI002435482A|nr:DUF4913 domain-containing protein [Lysinibacter sp. HNR]WGD37572.1 DUF4913 domain-containing protein [Lysinibacter sp. HNR]
MSDDELSQPLVFASLDMDEVPVHAQGPPHPPVDLPDGVAEAHWAPFYMWVVKRLSRVEWVPDNYAWCPQWYDHPEAVDRLHALWLMYLTDEAEGTLSSWWVNHWDRHHGVLFGRLGIFLRCGRHQKHEPTTEQKLPLRSEDLHSHS